MLVVDNGTTDARVLAFYKAQKEGPVPFQAIVKDEPFNFSRAINKGIAAANGEMVLLLNNDIEILEPNWLKEMVCCFDYPDVGVVGAKLLYPDRTIQHAGVIVGFGDLAGHWYLKAKENFPGPMGRLWTRQSLSAVTGACLLVSKEAIARIGPLDEERFAIAYNDVDFCLRARSAGFRVVWTPFATLLHHESASRGSDETPKNFDRFRREQDNLRSRHATHLYEDFAVSPWHTKNRSNPEWARLARLPGPR
ncbi:MAG TPA: glycosyltransferase [Roseiarcus sp.]|nr:glycosyltransferase [Roseiarcus sp.]